jgi:hypothetical protein
MLTVLVQLYHFATRGTCTQKKHLAKVDRFQRLGSWGILVDPPER